jgi:hypothetical protein
MVGFVINMKYTDKQRLRWLNKFIFKDKFDLDSGFCRSKFTSLSKMIDYFIDQSKKKHSCNCYLYRNCICDKCQGVEGKILKDKKL